MKNKFALFLFLACSPTIIMTSAQENIFDTSINKDDSKNRISKINTDLLEIISSLEMNNHALKMKNQELESKSTHDQHAPSTLTDIDFINNQTIIHQQQNIIRSLEIKSDELFSENNILKKQSKNTNQCRNAAIIASVGLIAGSASMFFAINSNNYCPK